MSTAFGSTRLWLHRSRFRRRGFTLKELLVVIGIIGLSLALLLPALRTSREIARRSRCTNNLKQIGLGLQNYADTYKCFPSGAIWGDGVSESDPWAPEAPYHHSWPGAILPFSESAPPGALELANRQIGIMSDPADPTVYTGQYSTKTPPAYGRKGFKSLHSQQLPAFRCPSDMTFNGLGDMPMNMMWTNYAGNEGFGFFSAVQAGDERPQGSAPEEYKGLFPFGEFTTLARLRDGSSNLIACAEVTAGSVCDQFTAQSGRWVTPQTTPSVGYKPDLTVPSWFVQTDATPTDSPPRAGAGKPRSELFISGNPPTRAPMVFRSLWVALTTSVTGGAPCAGGDFFCGALGGPCGGDDGFELHGAGADGAPLYGIAPLYNGLYPPNSDWPGPDSAHPGLTIVGFADGSTRSISNDINYRIWASLQTRAGAERVSGGP